MKQIREDTFEYLEKKGISFLPRMAPFFAAPVTLLAGIILDLQQEVRLPYDRHLT